MTLKGLLRLLRPKNAIMSAIGVIVGWLAVTTELNWRLLLAAAVPPLVLMGGNAINDYFDAPIDKINKPDRPIPSGQMSLEEAKLVYVIFSIAGVLTSVTLGLEEVVIAALFSIAWYIYAWKLKGTGLPGNVLVSLGVAFTLIFGSLAAGELNLKVVLFSSVAFTSNLAREIVKTVEDIEGDKAYGLKTFAVRYGFKRSGRVVALLAVASAFLSAIPLAMGMVGMTYAILSVVLSSLILIKVAIKGAELRVENARNVSSMLKLAMFLGLLGMLLDPITGA